MTSKPEQKIITINILCNISRSKGYQAMGFGQLIEYNIRNIFLGTSYINWVKKLVLDLFH